MECQKLSIEMAGALPEEILCVFLFLNNAEESIMHFKSTKTISLFLYGCIIKNHTETMYKPPNYVKKTVVNTLQKYRKNEINNRS